MAMSQKKSEDSASVCLYICAISDLLSAIMYLYVYIYMTSASISYIKAAFV